MSRIPIISGDFRLPDDAQGRGMGGLPIYTVDKDARRLRELRQLGIIGDEGFEDAALPPTPVEQAHANVVDALIAREREARRQANPSVLTAAQRAALFADYPNNPEYAQELIRAAEQGDRTVGRAIRSMTPTRRRQYMRSMAAQGNVLKR